MMTELNAEACQPKHFFEFLSCENSLRGSWLCLQSEAMLIRSRMKAKLIALMTGLLIVIVPACGQRNEVSDYNYQKACEAFFDENDDQKALELLNKHLEENDRHADFYYLRARIYYRADKNIAALRDIKKAMQYRNRQSRVNQCTLYGLSGIIHSEMEMYDEAARLRLTFAKSSPEMSTWNFITAIHHPKCPGDP